MLSAFGRTRRAEGRLARKASPEKLAEAGEAVDGRLALFRIAFCGPGPRRPPKGRLETAALVTVALLVIYGYARWQLADLVAEAARLDAREQAFAMQVAELVSGAAGSAGSQPGVEVDRRDAAAKGARREPAP